MVKRSPSPSTLRTYPLIITKERLAIWEKARGLWKGRVPEPIREPKKITLNPPICVPFVDPNAIAKLEKAD